MRAADLVLDELLEYASDGGVIRFAGQRALIFDAVALGLLRKELVDLLGLTAARGVMTRFGYAHGWRTAETLEHGLPWESPREWQRAGGRLHRLQGMVGFEPVHHSEQASPPPFAEAIWRDSYEAEQHLLHFGEAEEPVCWSLCGFAAGYLSRAFGTKVFCVETSCRGRGDAVCRMRADSREVMIERGYGRAIDFYEQRELDDALIRVRETIHELERKLQARRRSLGSGRAAALDEDEVEGIVARSPLMRAVLDMARRVAPVDSTVLISGPTGSGKERLARFIHAHSSRAGGPFVGVNCGAMPEQLLESELFGHTKGAFTGATRERVGLFEAAHTGTLLLDEIGELTAATQTRLLRVLQEREVRRLGENHPRPVDVRILAATHRDLAADVAQGRFREDLYYRLRVVEIQMPPLRERPEDILPLARLLLAEAGDRMGRTLSGFEPAACEALLAHTWPGNVRELQNAVERAVAMARGRTVEAGDLPKFEARRLGRRGRAGGGERPLDPFAHTHEGSNGEAAREHAQAHRRLDMNLAEIEREHILAVLAAAGGNKAEAARRLDIGTATLFRKLKKYKAE
ncbi:sigma-54-dependent Fis family transcriptional regulator [Pseudenhygromyxa sp. WMMC2535]|uniref:sigma-54-dependent Fis family transcriptional regulator n=1 Tax=Pseudenhygromyxa sp. WMMC2535 TaxID=2712867 RepID=UPI00155422F6|nr:sigma-54-dependent Fis family transcriptional regulator [Pseudenhygromyxa sp. WMMC2535]NVB38962.1 sigma-54-dependent Fis family transcriptional regulator [Pseudenhygromyxa sp. WMMC2535]